MYSGFLEYPERGSEMPFNYFGNNLATCLIKVKTGF